MRPSACCQMVINAKDFSYCNLKLLINIKNIVPVIIETKSSFQRIRFIVNPKSVYKSSSCFFDQNFVNSKPIVFNSENCTNESMIKLNPDEILIRPKIAVITLMIDSYLCNLSKENTSVNLSDSTVVYP